MREPSPWDAYYRRAGLGSPRPTLLRALEGFTGEGRLGPGLRAVDLGCGVGRDALELLRRGFLTVAIDSEPTALAGLRRNAETLGVADRLETILDRMEAASWPECDLVNASFALPLCPPDAFGGLWARILASLRPEGRFAGQLYGPRDGWAGRPGLTILARAEVERLLRGLAVEL
ncbi:MAG TPA: methyltransferase domain-containing protein, partial [Geminicoccaceae bacterium]|nr:methyltransferase domain-containing protein [Geminicoccaceae bacterium]